VWRQEGERKEGGSKCGKSGGADRPSPSQQEIVGTGSPELVLRSGFIGGISYLTHSKTICLIRIPYNSCARGTGGDEGTGASLTTKSSKATIVGTGSSELVLHGGFIGGISYLTCSKTICLIKIPYNSCARGTGGDEAQTAESRTADDRGHGYLRTRLAQRFYWRDLVSDMFQDNLPDQISLELVRSQHRTRTADDRGHGFLGTCFLQRFY
jgi:hypothetical protein